MKCLFIFLFFKPALYITVERIRVLFSCAFPLFLTHPLLKPGLCGAEK